MLNALDKSTIVLLYVLCSILVLIVTVQIYRQNNKYYNGLHLWVLAHAMQLIGVTLLGLTGKVSPMISTILGSMIILLGFHYFIISFELFLGVKTRKTSNVIILAIICIMFSYYTIINNHFASRVIVFSSMMVYLSFQACIIIYRHIKATKSKYYYFPFIAFFMYVLIYSYRIVNAVIGYTGTDYLNTSPSENLFMMMSMFAGILMMMGLVYVINGHLMDQLKHHARKQAHLLSKTKTLAEMDSLTGLYNRMKFEEIIAFEMDSAKVDNYDLMLLILDIDHFKQINDRFGHLVGDETLKSFAAILKQHTRKTDYVARWGGDEFIILLPHTDDKEAMHVAKHLIKTIETDLTSSRFKVTSSVGISHMDQTFSKNDFIQTADNALYQAKKKGRNRIAIYQEAQII